MEVLEHAFLADGRQITLRLTEQELVGMLTIATQFMLANGMLALHNTSTDDVIGGDAEAVDEARMKIAKEKGLN